MALPSRAIKDALVEVLTEVQYKDEPAFTSVKGHPRGEFDGYPAVRVLPGDQPNENVAWHVDERRPSYIVRMHLEAKDDGSDFDHMYDLTDVVLDALQEADANDTLHEHENVPDTFILEIGTAEWYEAETQAGIILLCDIPVTVKYSKIA